MKSKGIHTPIRESSQEKSYLVPNQTIRGTGQPYALQGGFLEASAPIDPDKIPGSSMVLAQIPSPIKDKYIWLPDGTEGAPGLVFASTADQDSGRYLIGANNVGETINGLKVFDWTSSRLKLASGFNLQIADLTLGSVLFIGTDNQVSQDNSNLFWDDTNNRLGVGTNSPDRRLHVLDTSGPQIRIEGPSSGYFDVTVDSATNIIFAPTGGGGTIGLMLDGTATSGAQISIFNASTSGGAGSHFYATVASTTADASITFDTDGNGDVWTVGLDNDDDDKFKVSQDSSLGLIDYLTITVDGLAGVNQTSPTARLEVVEDTVGNEVFRLQSTATNDDPADKHFHGRVATTDATVTTINTIAVAATTTVMVEAFVRARRTGGTAGTAEDAAGYVIRGTYKNVAGTATLVGAVDAAYTAEDQAAWDATFTLSAANILLRVTGALDNNITWHSTVVVRQVSS